MIMTNLKEKCSCCGSTKEVMPKAGSGTVTHWICKECVISREIEVLPEYLENIQNFDLIQTVDISRNKWI